MSSISISHPFSGSHDQHDPNSPFAFPFGSDHQHEGSSSSVTFTMNPASQHPPSRGGSMIQKPRTPRTSLLGVSSAEESSKRSSAYELDSYEEAPVSEKSDRVVAISKGTSAHAQNTVKTHDVWKEIFLTSNGRDKALKLIQYAIRIYLFFHIRSAPLLRRSPTKAPWEADMLKGMDKAYSGLSLSRKCMILFNWLGPFSTIAAPQGLTTGKSQPKPFVHRLLHASPPVLLDLVCGVSDDLATFYKLGLLPARIGVQAEKMADWCWFSGTIVNLVEVGLERSVVGNAIRDIESRLYNESMAGPGGGSASGQAIDEDELVKLKRQHHWLQISRMKLVMDLIFVSYDVFHLKKYKEPAKAFTGMASAVLSTLKIYDKHYGTLSRSAV